VSVSHPLTQEFLRAGIAWGLRGAPVATRLADAIVVALESEDAGDEPIRAALEPFAAPGVGVRIPERILAEVHHWVLSGEASELARWFPTVGGFSSAIEMPELWPAFRDVVAARAETLQDALSRPWQGAELGLAPLVAAGLQAVASGTTYSLRLLEPGAGAGLNLCADRYAGRPWCTLPPACCGWKAVIAERSGCDRWPISPHTADGLRRLQSCLLPDDVEGLDRLAEAVELARQVPAVVVQADAADWLEEELNRDGTGLVTVVLHSLLDEALNPARLALIDEIVHEAASHATQRTPLALLRIEPVAEEGGAERVHATVTTWPGGARALLATSDEAGRRIVWDGELAG